MSLLRAPSVAGFRPKPGQYVGEFSHLEEGPPSKFTDKDGNQKATVRWVWHAYQQDGTTRLLNDEGEPADVDGLSSSATGKGSNAGAWIQAHLGRPIRVGEDMDAVEAEMKGKKVLLLYIADEEGRGRLSVVMPYSG